MSHEDTRTRRGIALPPFPFALSLSKGRLFFRVAKKDGASTSSARTEESRSFVSLRLRANPIGYTTPSSAFFSPAVSPSAPDTSDRKSDAKGKRVPVRVELGGRGSVKKKNHNKKKIKNT